MRAITNKMKRTRQKNQQKLKERYEIENRTSNENESKSEEPIEANDVDGVRDSSIDEKGTSET